jgi:hypothetical protein
MYVSIHRPRSWFLPLIGWRSAYAMPMMKGPSCSCLTQKSKNFVSRERTTPLRSVVLSAWGGNTSSAVLPASASSVPLTWSGLVGRRAVPQTPTAPPSNRA